MSKQIAVRLPDDVVAYIDEVVACGVATSRADVVTKALDRDRRRTVAARDAAILAKVRTDKVRSDRDRSDKDLDRLADYAAGVPLDDLA
ncbi:MAG: antitoxin [Jatrophihabitantaceae bacterium]